MLATKSSGTKRVSVCALSSRSYSLIDKPKTESNLLALGHALVELIKGALPATNSLVQISFRLANEKCLGKDKLESLNKLRLNKPLVCLHK